VVVMLPMIDEMKVEHVEIRRHGAHHASNQKCLLRRALTPLKAFPQKLRYQVPGR